MKDVILNERISDTFKSKKLSFVSAKPSRIKAKAKRFVKPKELGEIASSLHISHIKTN